MKNKYVITARDSHFAPCDEDGPGPSYVSILRSAFDLENPSVIERLDRAFDEGCLIMGHYLPEENEIHVALPLRPTPLAIMRLREILGSSS